MAACSPCAFCQRLAYCASDLFASGYARVLQLSTQFFSLRGDLFRNFDNFRRQRTREIIHFSFSVSLLVSLFFLNLSINFSNDAVLTSSKRKSNTFFPKLRLNSSETRSESTVFSPDKTHRKCSLLRTFAGALATE